MVDSLLNLAWLYHVSGSDPVQAHTLLDESLALSREVGDKEEIAFGLYLWGMLALSEGDMARASSQVEQALAFFEEMHQRRGTALSLYALAQVATVEGDYARSQALYEQSIGVAHKSGSKRTIPPSLEGLAAAVAAQGNPVWAAHLWGAAEALREALGTPLPPVDRASYQRAVTSSRTQLGEQAFARAWAEGRTMSLEQVLATPEQVALPTFTQREQSLSPTLLPHKNKQTT